MTTYFIAISSYPGQYVPDHITDFDSYDKARQRLESELQARYGNEWIRLSEWNYAVNRPGTQHLIIGSIHEIRINDV